MPASQPITIVAEGYGGNMPEDQAYDLLDDIDFYYNKVKCRKIEKLLPVLNKLVIEEQKLLQLVLQKKNFFPKTFGGIIEKVYLCTQSIINKEITL